MLIDDAVSHDVIGQIYDVMALHINGVTSSCGKTRIC